MKSRIFTRIKHFAGFAAMAFALAGSMTLAVPYFVERAAIRDTLIQRLEEWSGGAVTIGGEIHVASLIALTIDVKDVRIIPGQRLDPIRIVNAPSLKAVIRFRDLLRGRLVIEKAVISGAAFVMKRGQTGFDEANVSLPFLDAAYDPRSLAERLPVMELAVRRSKIFYASGPLKPYRAIALPHLRYKKLGVGDIAIEAQFATDGRRPLISMHLAPTVLGVAPFSATLKEEGLEASFAGELNEAKLAFKGRIDLSAAPGLPVARHIKSAILSSDTVNPVRVSGEVFWAENKAALDSAEIRVGSRTAAGSLGLTGGRDTLVLNGTLAYDIFDLTPFVAAAIGGRDPFPTPGYDTVQSSSRSQFHIVNKDIRISAEKVQAGNVTAGPLAAAITTRADHVSVDVAELGLFGGAVNGGVEMARTPGGFAALKISGMHVDATALSQALSTHMPVSGAVDVTATVKLPLYGTAQTAGGLDCEFNARFPNGATIDAQASRQLTQALRIPESVWPFGSGTLPLLTLSLAGAFRNDGAELTVSGETSAFKLWGPITVQANDGSISGRLEVAKASVPTDANENDAGKIENNGHVLTSLLVSGNTASPAFFTAPGSNAAN